MAPPAQDKAQGGSTCMRLLLLTGVILGCYMAYRGFSTTTKVEEVVQKSEEAAQDGGVKDEPEPEQDADDGAAEPEPEDEDDLEDTAGEDVDDADLDSEDVDEDEKEDDIEYE